MNEKVMCNKCGKYEAEQCFSICEFCLGVSDEKEYLYQQLQAYKDKEDVYKKCWEELKQFYIDIDIPIDRMLEMEQKHNIKEVE